MAPSAKGGGGAGGGGGLDLLALSAIFPSVISKDPLSLAASLSAQSLSISKQFPFSITAPICTKGQLNHFRFFLEDMATARKYCCVVWP